MKCQKCFLLRSHGGSYDATSLLTYTPNASTSTSYCRATRSRFKRILGYKKKLSRSGRRRQATSRRLAPPGEPRVARTRLILCKSCIIKVGECRKLQATGHQMARPASFEARYPRAARLWTLIHALSLGNTIVPVLRIRKELIGP